MRKKAAETGIPIEAVPGAEAARSRGGSPGRRVLRRLSLLLAGGVLGLLLAEGALTLASRIAYPRLTVTDPDLGWKYRPTRSPVRRSGPDGTSYTIRVNSDGFRDDEFLPASPGPRVMVLGDSMTFGLEADQEDIWPRRLEEGLRADLRSPGLDVQNFAITGWGTVQQLLCLRKFGPVHRPDALVLAVFEHNDFDDNVTAFNGRFVPHAVLVGDRLEIRSRPTPTQRAMGFLRDHSTLYYAFTHRLGPVRRWLERRSAAGEEERLAVTLGVLDMLLEEAARLDAPVLLLYQRDPRHDSARLAAVKSLCVGSGVPLRVLEVRPELQAPGGHWNAAGHQAAADIVREALTGEVAFPARIQAGSHGRPDAVAPAEGGLSHPGDH